MDLDRPTPGLRHPLDAETARLLRAAVLEHRIAERRPRHPALLHVGTPGIEHAVLPVAEDPGAFGPRCDLIHALVRRAAGWGHHTPDQTAWVWLTRPGPLTAEELDLRYLAAAMHAYAEAGEPLTYVVVNRQGWLDPRSGTEQRWVRLREKGSPNLTPPAAAALRG